MSHLTTLIKRIKTAEENKTNQIEDESFRGRLMNLVEYLVYYDNWTEKEAKTTKKLIKKYDVDIELSAEGVEEKHIREQRLTYHYSPICLRCGRRLTNPYSKRKGLGPVCRRKVKNGDWGRETNKLMEKAGYEEKKPKKISDYV